MGFSGGEMQPPKQQHSWINLVEVKGQLVKKLGMERSNRYFDYLNRFLSLKLSKREFDKLCLMTIGKDNIRLHNQLICAVLKNAWLVTVGSKKPLDVVYHENGSVPVVTRVTSPLTSPLNLANGDILPPSARKARTGARDRRVVDRKSALGPNGSTNFTPVSSSTQQTGDFRVVENGESSSPNHQELMKQTENGALVSVNRVEQTEPLCKTDGKIIHAPLGVPHFPITIGGTHMGNNSKYVGVLHTDGLLDTTTLKEHMEQITTFHEIQHVSMDCANVLNRGLDVYLKGLIRSCAELNGSRSSVHKPTQSDSVKHPNHIQPVNDVLPGHHHQMQELELEQEQKPKRLVNLLDFRVAMELNRKQLGDDWPILLEKICCTHDFEE
ncbi:putative transcriptional coactivator Hfi1/Transcriptional adapter 1 [Helianthus annuus]|nr:putative transcriptional coactivator Hfi1/Transcriptional adapter 1 [Helianthus annuus]